MQSINRIIEACTVGTHALQVMLFGKKGEGDPKCFGAGGLSDDGLSSLVGAHEALMKGACAGEDVGGRVDAIIDSGLSLCDRLPVNAMTTWLAAKAPDASAEAVRAIANLFQVCLEVDRDGTTLQETFRLYLKLDLSLHLGQLGIETDDDALLAMGETLAAQVCTCPHPTDPAAWQVAGRKIEMWGEKLRGVRGPKHYAREILEWPEIKSLVPKLKGLPPMTVVVLGHSFSSYEHWSTHAPFNGVAEAALRLLGVEVKMPRIGEGGMTAATAREKCFDHALAMNPDAALFVIRLEGDGNREALADMARQLTERGVAAWCPDRLFPSGTYPWPGDDPAKLREAVEGTGLVLIDVGEKLDSHPRRDEFLCLDRIHMTGIYHKVMAAELLKCIAEKVV